MRKLKVRKMKQNSTTIIKGLMSQFASNTELEPENSHPKRYLWTDAFAVCNFLDLYNRTNEKKYLNLALILIYQVHHVLGQYRTDNKGSDWISGLDMEAGENHPTLGGLRIGKEINERSQNEPFNERLEWDRDGQYYHYLIKWMHALNNTSKVTGDKKYNRWAMELAKTAHKHFTYLPHQGARKRMYWKMSIDLNRALVPSMGQHDPLEGYITYIEIQREMDNLNVKTEKTLTHEIEDMKDICRGMSLVTDDPLGLGGLLSAATRITQLIDRGSNLFELLETVLDSSLVGLKSYISGNPMKISADYRLAFRELGLSIGIKGLEITRNLIKNNSKFSARTSLENRLNELDKYCDLGETIEKFWLEDKNMKTKNWVEHRDINTVMLATSMAPDGFLKI
jgi:hypothetical protein